MPSAITALLPAARAAAAELERDGRALTGDGLAARLRQDGYPIRNARLTALLARVSSFVPVLVVRVAADAFDSGGERP